MNKPIDVSATEDGIRLTRWFARHYPNVSMGELRKLCRTGQIRINSARCKGSEVLRSGDLMRIPPPVVNAKPKLASQSGGSNFSLKDLEELRSCIIYDDEDLVAFSKPAGLAVQGGTGIKKSVDKMAASMFPYDTILLVHRLDKETSGVLVVAKNQRAAQSLSAQFQSKETHKEYLALLSGVVKNKSGLIDDFMVKGRTMTAAEAKDYLKETGTRPQRAITKFKVLGIVHDTLTWMEFTPITGRTHQLRIHAAYALNAPIIGDTIYGAARDQDAQLSDVLSTGYLYLFARKLTLRHPRTNKIITITASMPDFMANAAKVLELKS